MIKAMVYRDGYLIERMTAERLDVCAKSLNLYGVKLSADPTERQYYYFGVVSFVMERDILRIDLFEPDNNGGADHHIRIVAYDW